MSRYTVSLTFSEPFRVLEWTRKDKRTPRNPKWARGQTFAFWHKSSKEPEKGRPYVTGTLLRTAVIRAVEDLLALQEGLWNGESCCPGEFHTPHREEQKRPVHTRHRATLSWSHDPLCNADSPCILCLLLGRHDGAGKQAKTGEHFHVRFGNLSLLGDPLYKLDEIGRKRLLNRVHPAMGKAQDFHHIWEIEPFAAFFGDIELDDGIEKEKQEALLSLIQSALSFVDRICGAVCRIHLLDVAPQITQKPADSPLLSGISDLAAEPGEEAPPTVEQLAEQIGETFAGAYSRNDLRLASSAIRELRRLHPHQIHTLPSGHPDTPGRKSHFLWDEELAPGATLRKILENAACHCQTDEEWRSFCERLGQALYEEIKDPEERKERIRPLGAAEYSQPPRGERKLSDGIVKGGYTREWVLMGSIRALTPFFVGVEVDQGKQTSFELLLSPDNTYRMPRSVLRGVLRRDLNAASGGMGCVAELGPQVPCLCRVCQILRGITIRDVLCSESLPEAQRRLPPELRHRIRLDPWTGAVSEGALFEMEVGPKGLTFPFLLRYRDSASRGADELPRDLQTVLGWWQDERLFLGGAAGTGKGRFKLDDLQIFYWDFGKEGALGSYTASLGFRGEEDEILRLSQNNEQKYLPVSAKCPLRISADYPWERVSWTITFQGPVLTNDPMSVLLEGGAHARFYQRLVIRPDELEPQKEWVLKGESVRGVLRSAVGRRHNLLLQAHDDCDCLLCRLFGSEHEAGMMRFEDLSVRQEEGEAPTSKRLDHLAIDRFTGGAAQGLKFDDAPLIGTENELLKFTGKFWLNRELSFRTSGADTISARSALIEALVDLRSGLIPFGAKSSIGYGWVHNVEISEPEWLQAELAQCLKALECREVSSMPPEAEISWPTLPALNFKPGTDAVYYPHYFLPPDEVKPAPVDIPIGHHQDDSRLHTGRLTCTLQTLTPLIVPDTSMDQTLAGDYPEKYKAYAFFRLGNDELMIPGSELRGMVSSLYEALTNSCFRVLGQKEHLSWHIGAGDAKNYQAGRVTDSGDQIRPYGKTAQLPFYAGPDPRKELTPAQLEGKEEVELWVKKEIRLKPGKVGSEKQKNGVWVEVEGVVRRKAAKMYFNFVWNSKRHSLPVTLHRGEVPGSTTIRRYIEIKEITYYRAALEKPTEPGWDPQRGYLKVTGPNMVAVSKVQTASRTQGFPASWDELYITTDGTIPPKEARHYTCCKDGNTYTIKKWCETFFFDPADEQNFRKINHKSHRHYAQVMESYLDNPQAPPDVFRSLPVMDWEKKKKTEKPGLRPGELIYFLKKANREDSVTEILPVRISRKVDTVPIGKHPFLNGGPGQDFRPCAYACLEECEQCTGRKEPFVMYREGAPVHGLCPACHLFGTTSYRGRVRFGFARHTGQRIWLDTDGSSETREVTLPLLERPRPTWVMTGPDSRIPGRKFYVHHQQWKKVVSEKINPSNGEPVEPDEKNRIVEPLGVGNSFTFEVYFENLHEWELGLLLYSIELEPGLAHKLGMGKPLGFGSVSIQVDKIEKRDGSGSWCLKELNKAELLKAGQLWLSQVHFGEAKSCPKKWSSIPRIEKLRKLLQYIENEAVEVRYPSLERSSKEGLRDQPGYVELKASRGARFKPEVALIDPWKPWWEKWVSRSN